MTRHINKHIVWANGKEFRPRRISPDVSLFMAGMVAGLIFATLFYWGLVLTYPMPVVK